MRQVPPSPPNKCLCYPWRLQFIYNGFSLCGDTSGLSQGNKEACGWIRVRRDVLLPPLQPRRAPPARGEWSPTPASPTGRASCMQPHRLEGGRVRNVTASEMMENGHLQAVPINCVSRRTPCRFASPQTRARRHRNPGPRA